MLADNMTTWMALATLKAAREGLDIRDLCVQAERLEMESKATLRGLGMTRKEMEADFPREVVIRGLEMIHADPEEFQRQCDASAAWLQARN